MNSLELLEKFCAHQRFACHSCDLHFWYPRQMPDGHWYEQMYGARDARLLPLEPGHRFFLSDPKTPRSGNLLDIGCGTGNFLVAARNAGFSVTGTELDPGAARFAREKCGLPRILSLSLADFVAQNQGEQFDVVTFFEVLEHQADPAGFLRNAASCIRPGGYAALSVPNRGRWLTGNDPLDYPPNHFLRWNESSLRAALNAQGFEVVSLQQENAGLTYTAMMINMALRSGLSSAIASDVPPSFRDLMQQPPEAASAIMRARPSLRLRIVAALGKLKYLACFPLAFLAMPYVRFKRLKGAYLYCVARRKD